MASQSVLLATSGMCSTKGEGRALAKYHPDIWEGRFISLASSPSAKSQRDLYSTKIQVLKQKVKDMLLKVFTQDTVEELSLINSLCRLGVSYHFEEEIEKELKHVFDTEPNLCMSDDHDLHTSALIFMVFRQHGYRMSCGIFNKFKDGDGKLKATISKDVRGMLSLYEASHLRVHGEDILDEAFVFTTTQLETWVRGHPDHALAKQVFQALQQPLFRGIPRLETRRFIDFYEEDETRDEMLLNFAKLDFNLLQLLHQQELCEVQKWWKDSNIPSELGHVIRDRIVECYFWMLGVFYEAQYSRARIFLTKVCCMVSVIDDIYDAYATFEESGLLKDAIQRWDASALEQLPKYMHVIYNTLLSMYEEMEKEEIKEGRSYSANYAKEAMKEWTRFQYNEQEWLNKDYVPKFEEHMETSWITICAPILAMSSFVGMATAGRQVFDWIQSRPICVKSCGIIVRLIDDIAGHKIELERKHIATTVQCYMSQYGVSEKEVVKEFDRRVQHAWKDLNEECLSPKGVSKHCVMQVHKLTRSADVVYRSNQDRFTRSEGDMKNYITLVFIDSIPLNDLE